jgi:hypothetical protein
MSKKRRVYKPRLVGGKVMMSADLKRLHKYMLEIEGIDHISDEMRAVVEELWPELTHKLPRAKPQPKGWPAGARAAKLLYTVYLYYS